MNTTKNERKNKALEFMKQLGIYKPYIKGFNDNDDVCFFELYGGFWAHQEPELQKKIEEIEKRFNCTVYAITHEFFEFGECFSFLLITDYKNEWDTLLETEDDIHYAFSFVWNKDIEHFSEFGTIAVKSFGGGIARVA